MGKNVLKVVSNTGVGNNWFGGNIGSNFWIFRGGYQTVFLPQNVHFGKLTDLGYYHSDEELIYLVYGI